MSNIAVKIQILKIAPDHNYDQEKHCTGEVLQETWGYWSAEDGTGGIAAATETYRRIEKILNDWTP